MDDAVHVENLLQAENVALDIPAANREEALAALAARLSRDLNIEEHAVLTSLAARERMGSTAIGSGIALPHARLAELASPRAAFARLPRPVAFDASDAYPVDLILAVIWPQADTEAFRASLTRTCRVLRNPELPALLRRVAAPGEVRRLLCPAADPA